MSNPTAKVDSFDLVTQSQTGDRIYILRDGVTDKTGSLQAIIDDRVISVSFDWKNSVRAGSTANLTLSGTQTIDGVACIAGDRVLAKNQTAGADNGIYVVAAGAWARSTDANTSALVTNGLIVKIDEGTTLAGTIWQIQTAAPITLGTTVLVFGLFNNKSFGAKDLWNSGLAASVSGNALTISLKQLDGTDPSTQTKQVLISFRSATAADGTHVVRAVSSALSLTIPSGATMGFANAVADYIYVYAIDNGGTVELAVATEDLFDESFRTSTTVLDTASDSRTVIYSTTARTNLAIRFLGRMRCVCATAGTWDSSAAPTNIGGPESDRSGIVNAAAATVSLSTGTAKTITSIVVPPGKFDISGGFGFIPTSTTSLQSLLGAVSLTDNTMVSPVSFALPDQFVGEIKQRIPLLSSSVVPVDTNAIGQPIATYRVNFSVQTTLYLVQQATFGVSTLTAIAWLQARRAR